MLRDFHEIFDIGIYIYKSHDTLRYMTVLYTKSRTLKKVRIFALCFLIYQNPDTLRYAIFGEIFEIGGGGQFYKQKTMHFVLNSYMQKTMHSPLRFYIQKA